MDIKEIQNHTGLLSKEVKMFVNDEINDISILSECIKKVHILTSNILKLDDKSLQVQLLISLMTVMSEVTKVTHGKKIFKSLADMCKSFDPAVTSISNLFQLIEFLGSNPDTIGTQKEMIGTLVQNTYKNLKGIADVFDTCLHHSEQHCEATCCVFTGLVQCSVKFADIDVLACANIWKILRKFLLEHKENIKTNFNSYKNLMDSCLLCCKSFEQLVNVLEQENGNNNKLEIVVKFFMSVVLQIIKGFNTVIDKDSCYKLVDMLAYFQRYFYPHNFTDVSSMIKRNCESFKPLIDVLFTEVMSLPHAAESVADRIISHSATATQETQDVNYTLLILHILNNLSTTADATILEKWMDIYPTSNNLNDKRRTSVLDFVFQHVTKCRKEMFLFRKSEDSDEEIRDAPFCSLYEDLLCKICAFITSLPECHFQHVEKVLLLNLLESSRQNSMLASDVWCFVAGLEPDKVRMAHFIFLGKLIIGLGESCDVIVQNISSLFGRMFWFLQADQHGIIIETFQLSSKTVLPWRYIPVWQLHINHKHQFVQQLCAMMIGFITVTENCGHSDNQIVDALHCLVNITSDKPFGTMSKEMKDSIIKPVVEFWMCFNDVTEDIEMNESLTIVMLQLLSNLFGDLQSSAECIMLGSIRRVLLCIESLAFQLQCCKLLSKLGDFIFHEENELKCLSEMSTMFQFLLSSSSWLVQGNAMKALKDFAEVTTYSQALSSFLPPEKKKEFGKFLKKQLPVNIGLFDVYHDIHVTLLSQEAMKSPQNFIWEYVTDLRGTRQLAENIETYSSKKRKIEHDKELEENGTEDNDEDKQALLESALKNLEDSMDVILQNVQQYDGQLPKEYEDRIDNAIQSLQKVKTLPLLRDSGRS